METNENSGERKIKRFKVRERHTDPLTEGLEQAMCTHDIDILSVTRSQGWAPASTPLNAQRLGVALGLWCQR